jgi:hypothetical protein
VGTETYDDPQFAGSGPIDCLYVSGRQTGGFTLAKKSRPAFVSDHFADSIRFLLSGTVPTPGGGGTGGGVRISALLPNPDGPDVGREWVRLKNSGSQAVNLDGWQLRDEANNTLTLAGSIGAGAERMIMLANGQLPLNNGGDEIELLDAAGNSVQVVSYTGGQAESGEVILVGP